MNPRGDSNNRNSISDEDKARIENAVEDLQVIRTFYDLFSTKLMNAKIDQTRPKEYTSEANILRQINGPGVLWGLGAGISTFAFLRRGPVILIRALNRRKNANGGGGVGSSNGSTQSGYTFNSETVQNPFQKPGGNSNVLQNGFEPTFKRRGGIFGAFFFMFDAAISLSVAASVSWMMTEKDEIRSILADIPLVEGRSIVSEEVCADAISAYYQNTKEFWRKGRNSNENSAITLDLIQHFVRNCEKRQAYEEELKKQQGISSIDHISIPSPGVPRDYVFNKELEKESEFHESDLSLHSDSMETISEPSMESWESFNQFDSEKSERDSV